jgi:hypothetical protein
VFAFLSALLAASGRWPSGSHILAFFSAQPWTPLLAWAFGGLALYLGLVWFNWL